MNINDHVWVHLNDHGKKVFEASRASLETVLGYKPKAPDHGWCKFQMWCLMETFGPVLWMGAEVPFTKNEIYFSEPPEAEGRSVSL